MLDELVGAVRGGQGRSLVLRGEAGIGKTALLEYLVESASDLTLIRAVGVESEMELAYASLHQLCAPRLAQLGSLPAPQRLAMEVAFGVSAESERSRPQRPTCTRASGRRAQRLLQIIEVGALDAFQLARLQRLRAQISFASRHGSDAPTLLLEAATRLEPIDRELARETYLDAFFAALTAGRLTPRDAVLEVAEATRAAPRPAGPPRPPDLLLDGIATLIVDGYPAGAPILRRALTEFCGQELAAEQGLRWLPLAAKMGHDMWDDESWHVLSSRLVDLARDAGALTILPIALSFRVAIELFAGKIAAAESLGEEIDAASQAMHSDLAPYATLLVAAWRGREQETLQLIETATPDIVARGEGQWLSACDWATAVLFNGRGRFDEALVAAEQARVYPNELGVSSWALPDLVEAAARSGKPARASREHPPSERDGICDRQRLDPRERGVCPSAGDRRRERRTLLSQSHRVLGADPHPRSACPRATSLRRVATGHEPPS